MGMLTTQVYHAVCSHFKNHIKQKLHLLAYEYLKAKLIYK